MFKDDEEHCRPASADGSCLGWSGSRLASWDAPSLGRTSQARLDAPGRSRATLLLISSDTLASASGRRLERRACAGSSPPRPPSPFTAPACLSCASATERMRRQL